MSAEPMAIQSLDINELLTELARLAACLEGGGGRSCGIVLHVSGLPSATAYSDETAARMEGIQQEIQDGPCLTAMRTGQIASVEDTTMGGQWAEFGARAAAEGVGSSLSVPLAACNRQVGALNLYAPGAGAFCETRLRWARGVATAVSGVLALAASRSRAGTPGRGFAGRACRPCRYRSGAWHRHGPAAMYLSRGFRYLATSISEQKRQAPRRGRRHRDGHQRPSTAAAVVSSPSARRLSHR